MKSRFFQPPQVNSSQISQDIYKHHGDDRLILPDDTKSLPLSSKDYPTSVEQKSGFEKGVHGRNANVYVAEPHRTLSPLRENERSDFSSPTRPSNSQQFPKTSTAEKIGVLSTQGGAQEQRLKEEGIGRRREEEEILDEIDELYGKIKPTNKPKVQGQVNAESRSGAVQGQFNADLRSGAVQSRDKDPIAWKSSTKPSTSPSQFASTSPSSSTQVPNSNADPGAARRTEFPSSRPHLPRSDVAQPSQPPPRREEARQPPQRTQLPRTDIGRASDVASPQPPRSDPVDTGAARSHLPRTNLGRNQPTVGHRMLRDVLRGRNGLNQSTPALAIDGTFSVIPYFSLL